MSINFEDYGSEKADWMYLQEKVSCCDGKLPWPKKESSENKNICTGCGRELEVGEHHSSLTQFFGITACMSFRA